MKQSKYKLRTKKPSIIELEITYSFKVEKNRIKRR